jgi:hypothetical protein
MTSDVSAHSEARRAHLERIRPLAAAWHSSPEGLAWHREHGRRDWSEFQDRDFVTRNCDRCGTEYATPFPDRSRFCSGNCSRAVREAQGAYNVWVNCPICGIEFSQNKYKHTPTTCSRICGQRLRRQKSQVGGA